MPAPTTTTVAMPPACQKRRAPRWLPWRSNRPAPGHRVSTGAASMSGPPEIPRHQRCQHLLDPELRRCGRTTGGRRGRARNGRTAATTRPSQDPDDGVYHLPGCRHGPLDVATFRRHRTPRGVAAALPRTGDLAVWDGWRDPLTRPNRFCMTTPTAGGPAGPEPFRRPRTNSTPPQHRRDCRSDPHLREPALRMGTSSMSSLCGPSVRRWRRGRRLHCRDGPGPTPLLVPFDVHRRVRGARPRVVAFPNTAPALGRGDGEVPRYPAATRPNSD